MTTRILYLHGLESGPNGTKARYLRGISEFEVTAPQLPTQPLVAAIEARRTNPAPLSREEEQSLKTALAPCLQVAEQALAESQPQLVIGSSFGGGVACVLAAQQRFNGPMVLLAPAAKRLFGINALPKRPGRVVILHGRSDSVVAAADSMRLCSESAGEVMLWLTEDEHRLLGAMERGALDEAIAFALR